MCPFASDPRFPLSVVLVNQIWRARTHWQIGNGCGFSARSCFWHSWIRFRHEFLDMVVSVAVLTCGGWHTNPWGDAFLTTSCKNLGRTNHTKEKLGKNPVDSSMCWLDLGRAGRVSLFCSCCISVVPGFSWATELFRVHPAPGRQNTSGLVLKATCVHAVHKLAKACWTKFVGKEDRERIFPLEPARPCPQLSKFNTCHCILTHLRWPFVPLQTKCVCNSWSTKHRWLGWAVPIWSQFGSNVWFMGEGFASCENQCRTRMSRCCPQNYFYSLKRSDC